jgi:hypothetical protein
VQVLPLLAGELGGGPHGKRFADDREMKTAKTGEINLDSMIEPVCTDFGRCLRMLLVLSRPLKWLAGSLIIQNYTKRIDLDSGGD